MPTRPGGSKRRGGERCFIAVLCVVAAARVLVFSAVCPLFNNVDEQSHVDLVLRYAQGDWPRRPVERIDPGAARLFVLYGTPEYLNPPEIFRGGFFPGPLWAEPPAVVERALETGGAFWARLPNHEAHSPPVYYAVAALWYRLGRGLGLSGGRQLYWVRFLNVGLFGLLVWGTYVFCRMAYPDRLELRVGVPLLLAFLPQDVFYSVNSDVLSAPLSVLSLILLLTWYGRERPSRVLSAAVGLATAATFLVKYTNVALPIIFAALALLKAQRVWRGARRGDGVSALAVALLAAALPVGLWFGRNYAVLGEVTGTRVKVQLLGWSPLPAGAWLHHPIFTPEGALTFWDGLMRTFWRGEFMWHGRPIASPVVDWFYTVSSAALLAAAAVPRAFDRWRVPPDGGRDGTAPAIRASGGGQHACPVVEPMVWGCVGLSVLCLAWLSVSFEYGRSFYPSRGHPYFTSGRLILSALVPFLVLYVDGLAVLTRRVSPIAGTLALIGLIDLLMLVSEVALHWHLLANPFNWFALP